MLQKASILTTVVPLLLLSSCYSSEQLDAKLRSQAAQDLNCPAQDLEVHPLSDTVNAVVGCGVMRSYARVCQLQDCSWVREGEKTEVATAKRPGATGSQPAPAQSSPPPSASSPATPE